MPTIEELFKSSKLANGQTAQQKYDVKNSKEIEVETSAGQLALSFKAINVLRRNLGARTKETKLEEEVTGLRILSNLSSPFIYGTDIIRLSRKSTNIVDIMKDASNTTLNNGSFTNNSKTDIGAIGTFLNKQKDKALEITGKLGIQFPEALIPSRLYLNPTFNTGADKGGEGKTMETLAKIKSASGGNEWGNLLKDLGPTPSLSGILGTAIDKAKSKINKLSFGSRKQGAQNRALQSGTKVNAVEIAPDIFDLVVRPNTPYDSATKYSTTVDETADEIKGRTDLSTFYSEYTEPTIPPLPATNYVSIPNVVKNTKIKFSENNLDNIEVIREMKIGSDFLNTKVAYHSKDGLTADTPSKDGKTLEGYDFIPLKFWSVGRKMAVNFRATISGLSETLTPSWDSSRFIGNPFNFYTYNSIERSVTFSFKVYSLNQDEHVAAWQRLSFLTSLVYPQGYVNNVAVTPPFLKFTLGNMYNNKECFIDSLTYTVDDTTTWETATGINSGLKDWKLPKIINVDVTLKLVETVGSTYQLRVNETDKKGKLVTKTLTNSKGKKYEVPVVKTPESPKALYGFGKVPIKNYEVAANKSKALQADGSPKPKEGITPLSTNNTQTKVENPIIKAPSVEKIPAYTVTVVPMNGQLQGTIFADGVIAWRSMFKSDYPFIEKFGSPKLVGVQAVSAWIKSALINQGFSNAASMDVGEYKKYPADVNYK
jgi:hypothetical protein